MSDSQSTLTERRASGEHMIAVAAGSPFSSLDAGDRVSYASDAVSDILTALFGPAGGWANTTRLITMYTEAVSDANEFLSRAMRAYKSDAVDYEADSGTPGRKKADGDT